MSEHRRIKPVADRVLGHTLPSTERTELPTPGGLTIADDPVVGAHLRVAYRNVGVVKNGQASIEQRSHRTVVAVTVSGVRVPFHPDVWARWIDSTDRGMGAWV